MTVSKGTQAASPYQQSIADYWNAEKYAVNHELGRVDEYFHHHYGIGEADETVTGQDKDAMVAELHRLENKQARFLTSYLGRIGPDDRVLDAGCGRGGTSFMLHSSTGCAVEGYTLSTSQHADACAQAQKLGIGEKVRFHVRNMLDTGLESGSITASWNNESTMYTDLGDLFAEHARVLKRGGRYVTITGCASDTFGRRSRSVSKINTFYACDIHFRSDYLRAMLSNRLVPTAVVDLSPDTLPYWNLRAKSHLANGVESAYLTAFQEKSFQYMLIAADRI